MDLMAPVIVSRLADVMRIDDLSERGFIGHILQAFDPSVV